jgi:hypothetical protein
MDLGYRCLISEIWYGSVFLGPLEHQAPPFPDSGYWDILCDWQLNAHTSRALLQLYLVSAHDERLSQAIN